MEISMYKSLFFKKGEKISIFDWLKGTDELNNKIHSLRSAPGSLQDEIKKTLPVCIPSGIFASPDDNGLLKFSGIMCIDFDYVPDIDQCKIEIMMNPHVWYCGLSARGKGLFALVKVSDQAPYRWKEYFISLANTFGMAGRYLDMRASNISRKRFYSYDPEPAINDKALNTPFYLPDPTFQNEKKIKITKQEKVINQTRLDHLIRKIESYQVDITADYNNWISIAGALANIFGEEGRSYYHRISQFYYRYDQAETDKQYNICLRNMPNFGEGIIFHIAKTHGIYLK